LTRLIIISLFIISITTNAYQMKRESYIDIPTASLTQGLYVNVHSSYPIKDVNDVKFDPDFGIDFSYNKFGGALKWYDGADFAMDLSYQILSDSGGSPGLSLGISEISTSKYISTAGSDEVVNDEDYTDRPPEIASAYIVGTKKISKNFEMTLGIGRGRFVGYGPRSFVPNTDVFSDEKHENWALGLFGGTKIIFPNNLSFIVEADGRDANIGIEYQNELVKGTLALNKLELFGNEAELSPRISLNLSYKIMDLKAGVKKEEKKKFPVVIELIDKESGEPVKGHTITIDKKGDTVKASAFKETHSFSLEPGMYTSHILATNYKDKEIEMAVKKGISENLYTIELSKKEILKKPVEAKDSIKVVDNFGDIKNTVENISIKFPFKKFDITVRAYGILDRVVELIGDDKDINLIIVGHTCDIGTYEDNQKLSEKRAENVKEYLIGRGISPDRISTEAYGERRPIADNDSEENRKKNRRAAFILYRKK